MNLFPPKNKLTDKIKAIFLLDRAIAYSVFSKFWAVMAGPITVFLIAKYFSPVVQGYHYAFGSLLNLIVFAELGLSYVILQFISHEFSNLSFKKNYVIDGNAESRARLISLGNFLISWYFIASIIILVPLIVVGCVFFSAQGEKSVQWFLPWITLSVLSVANLSIIPFYSILTGCNQVRNVNFINMLQNMLCNIAIWISIVCGAMLWTSSISSFARAIIAIAFLTFFYKDFFRQFFIKRPVSSLNWYKEIWPMQWRIAMSSLSGFFIFSLYVPVLFHYNGAVIAGQMGATWTIINAVTEIANNWVTTKIPQFNMYIAKKEYLTLDKLYLRSSILSMGIAILGESIIIAILFLLNKYNISIGYRFLPLNVTFYFIIGAILSHCVLLFAIYLRAHKREPYLITAVLSAICISGMIFWVTPRYGVLGMSVGNLILGILFFIPNAIIFVRCREKWHIEP